MNCLDCDLRDLLVVKSSQSVGTVSDVTAPFATCTNNRPLQQLYDNRA